MYDVKRNIDGKWSGYVSVEQWRDHFEHYGNRSVNIQCNVNHKQLYGSSKYRNHSDDE